VRVVEGEDENEEVSKYEEDNAGKVEEVRKVCIGV
jgi:hypothetical protein